MLINPDPLRSATVTPAYYTLCQGRFGHLVPIEDWWNGSYTCTSSQHHRQPLYGKQTQSVFLVSETHASRWATLPPAHIVLLPATLPLAHSPAILQPSLSIHFWV
jgi:hypothetical protein